MKYPRTCPKCNESFNYAAAYYKHLRVTHAWVNPRTQTTINQATVFDRLLDIKSQVKTLMDELEAERFRLHERIIQIDTTLAQYKKGCLPV